MRVEIAEGTFKVITEVKKSVVVNKYDERGDVCDSFAFGIGDGELKQDKFVGNTTVDGKIAYIAKVDTDDEKTADQLKKLYGKALLRAKAFEDAAVVKINSDEFKTAQELAAIDALFGGAAVEEA